MNDTRIFRFGTLSLLLSLLLGMSLAATADEQTRRQLFANDYVTVERVTLAPGAALPDHDGEQRIVYSLSDYRIAWTEAGTRSTRDWREGQVHEHAALHHAVENTGNTVADFLVVARTKVPLPAAEATPDAGDVAGGYAAVVGKLDTARVLRVALPPGAAQPLHGGAARLVYALNDYSLRYTGPDGAISEVAQEAGALHWHDAGEHAAENIGSETARYVIFAFAK
jgi:quercetin dioxygenase-like cupin family protein